MKIEKTTPREHLCNVGDFIYSNDSDILYMISETKEGFMLLDIKRGIETNRAANIPTLLEFLKTTSKVIIPGDDVTVVLKSNHW